ncbi:MAG: hypothetical protein MMC23_000984 [Stictis urceolatum]|nr:hypothetical protein [Stictis urceolata]
MLSAPNLDKNRHNEIIVLIGGANGIGKATVGQFHSQGAQVVFGDISETSGTSLAASLESSHNPALFFRTDVTIYKDIVALFKKALALHGHIDHAVCIVGTTDSDTLVDSRLSPEAVEIEPDTHTLDVNLRGPCYFCRVATVFLQQGREGPAADRSIILMGSVAGLTDAPFMPMYGSSKHGVMGLMRALRHQLRETAGIRINVVCPWMTDTALAAVVKDAWLEQRLPWNKPEDVAKVVVDVAKDMEIHGSALFMEGGRVWEVQAKLDQMEEQWMGESRGEFVRGSTFFRDLIKKMKYR